LRRRRRLRLRLRRRCRLRLIRLRLIRLRGRPLPLLPFHLLPLLIRQGVRITKDDRFACLHFTRFATRLGQSRTTATLPRK
jgi:hypothetical protein